MPAASNLNKGLSQARLANMSPSAAELTIGELSERSGVSASALRFYEREGLMERLRDRFTRCIGCGCLSFSECALVNPDDQLAEHGPGAHLLDRGV